MIRAFDLFEKRPDVVHLDARPQAAEAPRPDAERLALARLRADETAPQRFVHHLDWINPLER